MLSGVLLASLTAAILTTAALFVPSRTRLDPGSAWFHVRRTAAVVAGTALVAAAGALTILLLGWTNRATEVAFVVLVAANLAWFPVTRRWNARSHLCWASNVALFAAYLVFMLHWTLIGPVGLFAMIGAILLLILEAFAALLGAAYLWELCDAVGRMRWLRRSGAGVERGPADGVRHPFVSLHVPAYEEPPEMVIATLESLKRLDYDSYEIVAIDDNTKDESLWRPVESWCLANGVKFAHLQDWPGYKSGALNYALNELTDPRAEVIGVIDSDYQIRPDFLARCAPLFNDPGVGFVQTPQDYREWDHASYFRQLYYSYKYFFTVSQPSRNERDGAIFAGTMGLIRRDALADLGGWDEWCITEDAELSLRLLRAGWSGLHVDSSFGNGLMPLTFEALKGQRFRWCFGGIQILRMHWRSMLPGRASEGNRLTTGQRWAYLSGALQWYGDLISLIFFGFLIAGAVNVALGGGMLFRMLAPFLLGAIPLLLLLGFARAVALLKRGTGATWLDALGAFFVWQSTSLVVARASVQALFAHEAEFLRTPKTNEDARLWDAIWRNKGETFLALLGLAAIVISLLHPTELSGPLLAGLLLLPTAAYASAPINSMAAQRASLPRELDAKRRTENRRATYVRRSAAAVLGMGTVGTLAALAVALLIPAGHEGAAPQLAPDTDRTTPPSETPSESTPPSEEPSTPDSEEPTPSSPTTPTTPTSPTPSLSSSTTTPSASPSGSTP